MLSGEKESEGHARPETSVEQAQEDASGGAIRMSRRAFYSVFAAVAGTTLGYVAMEAPRVHNASSAEDLGRRLYEKAIESKSSEIMTMGEAVLFTYAQELLARCMQAARVPHGGHAYNQESDMHRAEQHPVWTFVLQNGLIPTAEEAIFRLVPSALLTKDGDPAWGVGLASNAAFAAMHNIDRDDEGTMLVHYTSLPVLQFILGTYCWHLMQTKGYSHAVATHVVYNSLMNFMPEAVAGERQDIAPDKEHS